MIAACACLLLLATSPWAAAGGGDPAEEPRAAASVEDVETATVQVVTIDDRICAGAICLRVGSQYYMAISSHDSAYDAYRLGTLCCVLAIGACIACRMRRVISLMGHVAGSLSSQRTTHGSP